MIERMISLTDLSTMKMFEVPHKTIQFLHYQPAKRGVTFGNEVKDGFLPGTLKYWSEVIMETGLIELIEVDRNNFINPGKVELLDPKYRKAYFDFNRTKVCTMSSVKYKQLLELLHLLGVKYKTV
ncbi:hypothetical protein VE23_24995 [Paenibacillus sp. D9]|nr:hypothetical protein VE23_24995 [Paenibacillus sp. D9]